VKYCRLSMTPMTTANRITGLIDGNVTQRMRCQAFAPSRLADSYKCRGTSMSAARKMIIIVPIPHSPSSTSDGFAHCGESNQSGVGIPRCSSTTFTGPVPGLRR
jgi:hypothetical protein